MSFRAPSAEVPLMTRAASSTIRTIITAAYHDAQFECSFALSCTSSARPLVAWLQVMANRCSVLHILKACSRCPQKHMCSFDDENASAQNESASTCSDSSAFSQWLAAADSNSLSSLVQKVAAAELGIGGDEIEQRIRILQQLLPDMIPRMSQVGASRSAPHWRAQLT